MKQFDYSTMATSWKAILLVFLMGSFTFYMSCSDPEKVAQPIEPGTGGNGGNNGELPEPQDLTIWEYLQSDKSGQFTILLKLLEDAGLESELNSGTSQKTLFAVLDRGFNEFIARKGYSTSDAFYSDPQVSGLLGGHLVTTGIVTADDLPNNGNFTTSNGSRVYVQKSESQGVWLNGQAKVIVADVVTKNGIVHIIDDVLEPADQTMLQILTERGNFTTFLSLMEEFELTSLLNNNGQRTVFAPNDEAFQNVVDHLGEPVDVSILSDIVKEEILLNHIINSMHFSFEFADNGTYPNLNLERARTLTVSLANNGDGFVEGFLIDDDSLDFHARNGIVHITNTVLIPRPTVVDNIYYNPDKYSILYAALKATGLDQTLDGMTNVTLFAPENQGLSDSLMAWVGTTDLNQISTEVVTDLLLYHVMSGRIESTDLEIGKFYPTALQPAVQVRVNGSMQAVLADADANTVQIVSVDSNMVNGVVHGLEAPVRPPRFTLLDLVQQAAMALGDFSYLDSAIVRTTANSGDDNLAELVANNDRQLTVFAPLDDAFETMLNAYPHWNNSVNNIPLDTLTMILKYHVVDNSRIHTTDLENGEEITTLEGSSITVEGVGLRTRQIKFPESGLARTVRLTTVLDAIATNGVAHAVDGVMLP